MKCRQRQPLRPRSCECEPPGGSGAAGGCAGRERRDRCVVVLRAGAGGTPASGRGGVSPWPVPPSSRGPSEKWVPARAGVGVGVVLFRETRWRPGFLCGLSTLRPCMGRGGHGFGGGAARARREAGAGDSPTAGDHGLTDWTERSLGVRRRARRCVCVSQSSGHPGGRSDRIVHISQPGKPGQRSYLTCPASHGGDLNSGMFHFGAAPFRTHSWLPTARSLAPPDFFFFFF